MQPGLHLASYSSGVTWACTDAGLLVTVCVPVHGSPSWPRLCPILHGALRAGQQRHADVLQVVRPWYMQTEVARRTARKAGKRASKHAETATATTISLADMPAGHDNTHGAALAQAASGTAWRVTSCHSHHPNFLSCQRARDTGMHTLHPARLTACTHQGTSLVLPARPYRVLPPGTACLHGGTCPVSSCRHLQASPQAQRPSLCRCSAASHHCCPAPRSPCAAHRKVQHLANIYFTKLAHRTSQAPASTRMQTQSPAFQ